MSTENPQRIVRMKLKCEDETQFRKELATRVAARLFVPMEKPYATDSTFALHLKFSDSVVRVRGMARVLRVVEAPRKGVQARFISLDPESIQFPLSTEPSGSTAAARQDQEHEDEQEAPAEPRPEAHAAPSAVSPPAPPPAPAPEEPEPVSSDMLTPSTTGEHDLMPWAAEPPPRAPSLQAPPPPGNATPAAGIATQGLVDSTRDFPENSTAIYSANEMELVMQLAAQKKEWSGGLRPLDLLGNYQLLDKLGAGGMAEVYAARATMGGGVEKIVALKLVKPEFGPDTRFGGLFLNEAKISASLQHPNLIQVFDYGEARGRPYLAMEYVRGRDLTSVINRMRNQNQRPTLAFALTVVLEMVKALEYLHHRNDADGKPMRLVHRDVSPGNVLLSEVGEVKVVDFGVAAAGTLTTQHVTVAGKYSYMAPEQATGQLPSPSWDLYAAGVVLHELLTLEPLFEGDTGAAGLSTSRRERHRPPSERNPQVTRGLDQIALTATHPESDQRYPSARQMRQALEAEARSVGVADVGAVIRNLFGVDLATERKRLDAQILEARKVRPPSSRSGPLDKVRRQVTRTSLFAALARRPALARALIVGALVAVSAAGWLSVSMISSSRELKEQLTAFDERFTAGQLTGTGGDTALDRLAAARALAPDDDRVAGRQRQLAQLFSLLADKALARGDNAEAAVHLQALKMADPNWPGVEEKLRDAEARVIEHSRQREK